jgi:hypothetical protein
MTMVSRKRRHSTEDIGQEPEAKIERSIPKFEKPRKPKKTSNRPLEKGSKKRKAVGK